MPPPSAIPTGGSVQQGLSAAGGSLGFYQLGLAADKRFVSCLMLIDVTSSPAAEDEALVAAQVRAYNAAFVPRDFQSLCVFAREENGAIVGGLTAKTYWNYLEVTFLWVHEAHRNSGHATALMAAAESEARRRGCANALLDTFSFQALDFYKKLGYTEFGRLCGFTANHERYYLHKSLADSGS